MTPAALALTLWACDRPADDGAGRSMPANGDVPRDAGAADSGAAERDGGEASGPALVDASGSDAADLAVPPPAAPPSPVPPTEGASPAAPPAIVGVTPADGVQRVDTETALKVVFSAPMDKAATEDAFEVRSPKVMGTFSWPDPRTMAFTPTPPLPPGTKVEWRLGPGARSATNVPLAATPLYSFQTVRRMKASLKAATPFGTLRSDGQVVSPHGLIIGDQEASGPELSNRAFLTFDLSPIPAEVTVRSATLFVTTYTCSQGSPLTKLGRIVADHVAVGPSLDAADFGALALPLPGGKETVPLAPPVTMPSPAGRQTVDATLKVRDDVARRAERTERSQFRLRFEKDFTGDAVTDRCAISPATAMNEPLLEVEYEY